MLALSPPLSVRADSAARGDTLSWQLSRSVAWLFVVGKQLHVIVIDPEGRRDAGERERNASPIPHLTRISGPTRRAASGPLIDENSLILEPRPGAYTFTVTSPVRQRIAVIAEQPFLDDCFRRDTLTVDAHLRVSWEIKWSIPDTGDVYPPCLIQMRRLPRPRR